MKWDYHLYPNNSATLLIQSCTGAGLTNSIGASYPTTHAGWLSGTSWYRQHEAPNIVGAPTGPHIGETIEYTRASIATHYYDAWAYFSSAVASLANFRHRSALHLAYYGALHASMSLLASLGIGVWRSKHTVVDDLGSACLITHSPTHEFAWQALSVWMSSSQNARRMQKELRLFSISLDDFTSELFGGSTATYFQELFGKWSLDLSTWEEDRKSRNKVSYRPSMMNVDSHLPVSELSAFIGNLWNLLSPTGITRFESIDRELFHLTIDYFKATHSLSNTDALHRVQRALQNLGLSSNEIRLVVSSYTTHLTRPNPVVQYALNTQIPVDDPRSSLAVISRSLMLIRFAYIRCSLFFQNSVLDPWARIKAEHLGFTADSTQIMSLDDLWQDLEIPLLDIEATPAIDPWSYQNSHSESYRRLLEFERVALWTLGT